MGRDGRGGRFRPYGNRAGFTQTCSLVVKKIPREQNKIAILDQHFGKFGQITNIQVSLTTNYKQTDICLIFQVQYEAQPDVALITYKSRREAQNAYRSTEPILNNRFIKIFWQTDAHKPGSPDESSINKDNAGAVSPPQEPPKPAIPLPVIL
jgi:RNA-binding protein 26